MSTSKPPPNPTPQSDDRNQYIPSFIAAQPFYASSLSSSDYLQHQRNNAEPKDTLDKAKWYDRGRKDAPRATKYRKGACENCGSASHKTKECLYRPRKTGAKYTGQDIQADELVEDVKLGWDAKRDRWNGYDASEYNQVISDYNELESLKHKTANGKAAQDPSTEGLPSATANDDDQPSESTALASIPTSTRQLRLREDTAAYLRDLNPETTSTYDPKTRSMDNNTSSNPSNPLSNATDIDVNAGFISKSDASAFERAQKYAWETQENPSLPSTQKLHLQANPTEGALLLKRKEAADLESKLARQKYLQEKYGTTPSSQSTISKPLPTITTSEKYNEYDATGKIKGAIKTTPKSSYPEDIFPNNHTSIFGSWWSRHRWGYACCHSFVKNSYCTGEEGKIAFEEAEGMRTGQGLIEGVNEEEKEKLEVEQNGDDVAEKKVDIESDTTRSEKRTVAEITSGVSDEDMESYKRNKMSASDPMAGMLGKDDLIES